MSAGRALLTGPYGLYLDAIRRLGGIDAIHARLLRPHGIAVVLRRFGARIAEECVVHGPLVVHNADIGYANLSVGAGAHVGRLCVLDLAGPVTVGPRATVSLGTTILTHFDVGESPLRERYPRSVAGVQIGEGAYIGANATILAGCHVGREAVVAAGAVVTEPVPDRTVVAGVPARAVRTPA